MATMDAILALDRTPQRGIEVIECGPFDLALLVGGRVVWRVPTELAHTVPFLTACHQVVVVTDDMAVFHRRVFEEAGIL